jgi:hypothetical protein
LNVTRVPSLPHEALLLLFRNRPELAPELVRDALGIDLPAYTEVRIESADLSEVVPAEYRADLVVLLVKGEPVFAIVVEVQLARDERKRFTWPVYVAGLRARFECPAIVLVVTASAEIARWASEAIELGPGASFTPLVLGPNAVPIVVDPERAKAEPELAVLSVMAHGHGDVELAVRIALAATAGIEVLSDHELSVLYSDLLGVALGEAARKAFQMIPQGYQFQSQWFRDATEKGLAAGLAQGKAADVLAVLEARGILASAAERERILATTDLATLDLWVRRAATITSMDELFD